MNKRKLSSLPGLKQRNNMVKDQMAKLQRAKERVSAELYERLESQYKEELAKLEPMIAEAQTEGERELAELSGSLGTLRKRGQELTDQQKNLGVLKQNGAIDDLEFAGQKTHLEKEMAHNTKATEKTAELLVWLNQCTTQETELERSLVDKLLDAMPVFWK